MRLILVTIVLLAGCRHYNPSTPEINIPVAWKETYPSSENYEEKNRFWETFEDPALNALEEHLRKLRSADRSQPHRSGTIFSHERPRRAHAESRLKRNSHAR